MNYKLSKNVYDGAKHKGVVLLFTLILLVVLATLAYTLTTKVRAQRSRQQYMVDYQSARYACDSAVKYADTALQALKFKLISRPNEPDFSDLFSLTDEEYQELIDIWEMDLDYADVNDSNDYLSQSNTVDFNGMMDMPGFDDINDMNDPSYQGQFGEGNDFNGFDDFFGKTFDLNEPNEIVIRGPYGPEWPYVTEPIEFEIGTAKVTIEIVDENSKYPIGWALIENDDVRNEAIAGFESFCEWMDVNSFEIEELLSGLDEIREVKEFKVDFKLTEEKDKPKDPNDTKKAEPEKKETRKRRSVRKNVRKVKEPKKKTIPAGTHIADFARLFNSSLIDTSLLSRATQLSDERDESALKYTSLWPSGKVNVNSAPRHVLEAALIFGGDSVEIAEEIIVARRQKPFVDIDELKKTLFQYSNSIAKCEKFITTESDFFTVRITAASGAAKVTSVVAVKRTGRRGRFEVIAAISGR